MLASRFEPALRLLAEVARTPAFPEREVDRLREERLAELLELRAEPRGLADERYQSLLYHASARYALPEGGVEATVSGFTRDHCLAFHERRFGPAVTSMIVVGDVERQAVLAAIAGVFDDWTGACRVAPFPRRGRHGPIERCT